MKRWTLVVLLAAITAGSLFSAGCTKKSMMQNDRPSPMYSYNK